MNQSIRKREVFSPQSVYIINTWASDNLEQASMSPRLGVYPKPSMRHYVSYTHSVETQCAQKGEDKPEDKYKNLQIVCTVVSSTLVSFNLIEIQHCSIVLQSCIMPT